MEQYLDSLIDELAERELAKLYSPEIDYLFPQAPQHSHAASTKMPLQQQHHAYISCAFAQQHQREEEHKKKELLLDPLQHSLDISLIDFEHASYVSTVLKDATYISDLTLRYEPSPATCSPSPIITHIPVTARQLSIHGPLVLQSPVPQATTHLHVSNATISWVLPWSLTHVAIVRPRPPAIAAPFCLNLDVLLLEPLVHVQVLVLSLHALGCPLRLERGFRHLQAVRAFHLSVSELDLATLDLDLGEMRQLESLALDVHHTKIMDLVFPETLKSLALGSCPLSLSASAFHRGPKLRMLYMEHFWTYYTLHHRDPWWKALWDTLEVVVAFMSGSDGDVITPLPAGPLLELHLVFDASVAGSEKSYLERLKLFSERAGKVVLYFWKQPGVDGVSEFESVAEALSSVQQATECADVSLVPFYGFSSEEMLANMWNRMRPAAVHEADWQICTLPSAPPLIAKA